MLYRSDWPEVGLGAPFEEGAVFTLAASLEERSIYQARDEYTGAAVQIVAQPNRLESDLYSVACWEFRIEADLPQRSLAGFASPGLRRTIDEAIDRFLSAVPSHPAYVYSKLVAGEPLYDVLRRAGFDEVEQRQLYRCSIAGLTAREGRHDDVNVGYQTLTQIPTARHESYRQQLLDICAESFQSGGSRHFRDSFLTDRVPGVDYILAVMRSNFAHVPPEGFLLAVDRAGGELLGFSVVARKSGMRAQTYTQLLSAVRASSRGRGIYGGLTTLLAKTFPPGATLLNVTHAQTTAIHRAYRDTGRVHFADTSLVRRVL